MDNGQEDIPSLGKDSHHCQARVCIPIALGLVSRHTPRRKRRYFNHMQTAHRANEMVGIPSPSMVPKDSHRSSHPSPRPSRISTRAAGLGRWCTSIPIYASQTTSSARTSGSHDGSRRRGCRFTLPPQLAPAAYLSLNSPLAALFLYHLCTALLHYCITRSLSYDGHPCFRAPAGAPSARDGHANSHLARSICHVSFLRLFRRRIHRNSRPRSLSSSLASSLPGPPGGPPC
jgi:hypothetical protein